MQFSFSLDVEDWMEFQKHFLQSSSIFKRSRVVLTWVLPIVIALLILKDIDVSAISVGSVIPYIIMGAVAVAWVIFFPNFYFNRVLNQARTMAQKGENPLLLAQRELIVDEATGITQKYPGEVFEIGWNEVVRIEGNDQYFYIFNTKMSAVIVPLARIKGMPDYEALLKLLTDKKATLAAAG